jgi:hypothetical protein
VTHLGGSKHSVCRWVSASVLAVFFLAMSSIANAQSAQYVRSCGKLSPLSSLGAGPATDPTDSTGRAYTGKQSLEFIPSLCVSERYDSNVYYAPPTPGLKRDDFVTNVNPMVRANHNGEYVAGYLDVGGFGEAYAHNSDLNFFGTINTLYVNLDNSIKRLLPNARLSITDYMRYAPTAPGFSNVAAGTAPGSPVNIQNVYAQGLLAYRSNNVLNTATALGSYDFTPLTTMNLSYSNMIIRFGSSPITSGATLFDTTVHTATVGATTRVSALDALRVSYSRTESEFVPQQASTFNPATSFITNNASLTYSRTLNAYLTSEIGGGVIVIDPGITTYALNASLVLNTPNYNATISYVRSAYPSFVGVGVPLVSDVVSVSAIQKLALNWELDETGGFSHASGESNGTAIAYNSYFAAVDLYYWISKMWSTALSFDYMNFNSEFGPSTSSFNRYAVTLSVKATWN